MENNNGKVRRPRISRSASNSNSENHYGENRTSGSRNYGSDRGYNQEGHRSSYGDRRPAYGNGGEGRRSAYGDRRPAYGNGGEGRRSAYGNEGRRPSYGNGGEGRSYNSSRGYNSDRSYNSDRGDTQEGHRSSFGDRRPAYGNGGEGRRPAYGNGGEGRRPAYGNGGEGRRPAYGNGNEGRRTSYGNGGGRPGFNKKKTFNKYQNRAAEEGINRMISDRPLLDHEMDSDNDFINIPIKNEVRLNKYIANSGICSRREADNYILAGVVTVNGEVVTELGSKVNAATDDIRFNGERLKGEEKVYIVMNKPKGYVTTASDPHAEKTVMDLLKGCNTRVFAVGRLDKNTTGVLMFTNDGDIAEKLTHPSYDKKKIYQVTLDRELSQEDYDKILAGVTLTDGDIAADDLQYIDENDKKKLGIEIHTGKNRIVRRIFESLGYDVKGLDRVYFAGLTKKGIKRGGWRYLTEGEVNILKMGAYR